MKETLKTIFGGLTILFILLFQILISVGFLYLIAVCLKIGYLIIFK